MPPGPITSLIFSGLIGLLVVLGSWLLLTTINPQLVILRAERELTPEIEEIAGVYLCSDVAGENCQPFTKSTAYIGELNDNVKYVKIKNTEEDKYGVVLHQDKDYEGRCAICLSDGCNDGYNNIAYVNDISSIHVFKRANSFSGEGVTLFELIDYNRKCGEGCYQSCPKSPCGEESDCAGVAPFWLRGGMCWGPFKGGSPAFSTDKKVYSIKVDERGKYLVALFSSPQYKDNCEIFWASDPNLNDGNYIGVRNIESLIILPIQAMIQ